MEKPRAKTELVVRTATSFNDKKAIYLSYTSHGAEQWIRDEAPHFGVLTPHHTGSYRLLVDVALWEVTEVAEYLRSYLIDEQGDGAKILRTYLEGKNAE